MKLQELNQRVNANLVKDRELRGILLGARSLHYHDHFVGLTSSLLTLVDAIEAGVTSDLDLQFFRKQLVKANEVEI